MKNAVSIALAALVLSVCTTTTNAQTTKTPAPVATTQAKPVAMKPVSVDLAKVPQVVKDAVAKQMPGSKILSAEMLDKNYLLHVMKGEDHMKVTASPEGKIIAQEKEMAEKPMTAKPAAPAPAPKPAPKK